MIITSFFPGNDRRLVRNDCCSCRSLPVFPTSRSCYLISRSYTVLTDQFEREKKQTFGRPAGWRREPMRPGRPVRVCKLAQTDRLRTDFLTRVLQRSGRKKSTTDKAVSFLFKGIINIWKIEKKCPALWFVRRKKMLPLLPWCVMREPNEQCHYDESVIIIPSGGYSWLLPAPGLVVSYL